MNQACFTNITLEWYNHKHAGSIIPLKKNIMMKKTFLVFSMTSLLLLSSMNMAVAQEQPKPKKDTVNMDTDAKPTFYNPVEDDKSGSKGKSSVVTIAIIAGAVVVAGGAGFFLLKKKK